LRDANSSEFATTRDAVIDLMPDQKHIQTKGATMRLGSYPCILKRGSIVHKAYRDQFITERHRHRYEVNNAYRALLSDKGMVLSGVSPDGNLVEIIELPREVHPFFVGVQFHPELKSRATKAHPIFREFIRASVLEKETRVAKSKSDPNFSSIGTNGHATNGESVRNGRMVREQTSS